MMNLNQIFTNQRTRNIKNHNKWKRFFIFAFSTILNICFAQQNSNKIYTSFDEALKNPENVYYLDFAYSNLQVIPKEIGKLENLKELNLNYRRKLTSLPKEFGRLKNLERLFLSGCNLSSLPEEFYKLKNLKELTLSYNKINIVSKKIKNFQKLQSLNLDSNGIKSLPEEFGELKNLEFLNIWGNPISTLPKSFYFLKKLKFLSISGIYLSEEEKIKIKNNFPNCNIQFN